MSEFSVETIIKHLVELTNKLDVGLANLEIRLSKLEKAQYVEVPRTRRAASPNTVNVYIDGIHFGDFPIDRSKEFHESINEVIGIEEIQAHLAIYPESKRTIDRDRKNIYIDCRS